jgi:hypothetical protein
MRALFSPKMIYRTNQPGGWSHIAAQLDAHPKGLQSLTITDCFCLH